MLKTFPKNKTQQQLKKIIPKTDTKTVAELPSPASVWRARAPRGTDSRREPRSTSPSPGADTPCWNVFIEKDFFLPFFFFINLITKRVPLSGNLPPAWGT